MAHQHESGAHWHDPFGRVFPAGAFAIGQVVINYQWVFLTGITIPALLLCCSWPRSRPCLDGGQCNHLLRWFAIHVICGLEIGSPPGGILFVVHSDLGPGAKYVLDDVDFADQGSAVSKNSNCISCRARQGAVAA